VLGFVLSAIFHGTHQALSITLHVAKLDTYHSPGKVNRRKKTKKNLKMKKAVTNSGVG
jgi:hypothetical protein